MQLSNHSDHRVTLVAAEGMWIVLNARDVLTVFFDNYAVFITLRCWQTVGFESLKLGILC